MHPTTTNDTQSLLRPITHFQGTRDSSSPEQRLSAVRSAARSFRESMLAENEVTYYKSVGLIRVPYPTKYGFLNAMSARSPFLHITNRLFIAQFKTAAGLKTLLVSPSDILGNRETPFFKRLAGQFGPFQNLGMKFIAPILSTVEQALDKAGITPESVDYITFDHLHTQDLRKWLGTNGEPGYFPNAKLLVMRTEWESTMNLLPPQKDWYCPDGIAGIDPRRVIQLDGDTMLGEGVALIRTPGHTEGNHSIVVHTPEGLMVTSENGIGPDSYAPLNSRMSAVRDFARDTGMEVVLNGNTLEGALDQYISMVQEKEIQQSLAEMCAKGYFIEPTSAAVVAGVKQYIDKFSSKNESIVSVFTGHGLKSANKIGKLLHLNS